MKRALLRIGQTAGFLLVFAIVYYFVSDTLKFKHPDGMRPMENFYALPEDTVDVLFLGSSHVGMNVDPSIIWEKTGIASYVCWGSVQPTWNTYYFLKECLKTQRPKLIVMDTYTVSMDMEYAEYEGMVKNVLGMRFSREKLEAARVSASPDLFRDVLLEFPTYHYRYSDLTAEDFEYYFWQKDTSLQNLVSADDVYPIQIMDTSRVTESEELSEKTGDYFYRIIECCREEGIPLLLLTTPYELSETDQMRFNEIETIAAENGLVYLNFNRNYEELGIDPRIHYRDPGHFNHDGIRIYSTYLAEYLSGHYDLPDRREDPGHIWNAPAKEPSQNAVIRYLFSALGELENLFPSRHAPQSGKTVPMSEASPVYMLEEQFRGGARNYADTGIPLYDIPSRSYTVLAQIDTTADSRDMVYLACFAEEEENYRGLLVRKEADGNLYVVFGTAYNIRIREFGGVINLAVVKNAQDYRVYVDGAEVGYLSGIGTFDRFDGTLLLGCELDADGRPFRYSDVRVMDLEVYDVALDAESVGAWRPRQLPEPVVREAYPAGSTPGYVLANRFEGDAVSGFTDTGISLYREPDESWTVLAQFREGDRWGSGVYFSCFAEEEGDYRGLLVRRAGPGRINILYGGTSLDAEVPERSDVRFAAVKSQYAYSIYLNGEKLVDGEKSPVGACPGNLLIGAQEWPDGEKFRFSAVTVYNLEYYAGAMEEADVLRWAPAYKEPGEKITGSPVNYRLEAPFYGDGRGGYIDTGIRLYDAADKDWTLTMTFRSDEGALGMLASCFAEVPGSYRGLLVNLREPTVLSLALGAEGRSVALEPGREQTLKIVKDGFTYTVYLNGEMVIDRLESWTAAYDGTLYIGCQAAADGSRFGYSDVQILELAIS